MVRVKIVERGRRENSCIFSDIRSLWVRRRTNLTMQCGSDVAESRSHSILIGEWSLQ